MQSTHFARLKRARINLLMDEPFFGTLMMQLRPVEDPSIPSFCTNGDYLRYNPAYMDTLDDAQLRTVLAHEVLHPALLHPFRLGNRDLKVANKAADYAINNFLDDYNQQAAKGGNPEPFPWPKNPDGKVEVLLDHKYDGMSFEEIYAAMMRNQSSSSSSSKSGGVAPASRGSPSGVPPGGSGSDRNTPPLQDSSSPSPGEFAGAPGDAAEVEAQEAQWKVALKQAAMMAKSQGRLPGEMERLVNDLLDPQASWREILRNLLTSTANDDYTWSRPNRRFSSLITGRCVLPSLHSPRLGRVAVAIDTSGSVDQHQLDEFLAEVRAIFFDCRPEKLLLIQCDAQIQSFVEIDPFDDSALCTPNSALKGGGGTDFCPVFERLEQEVEPIAALVYLTDLMGSFPDNPPAYPVIWACNNDTQAPFGDTVNI